MLQIAKRTAKAINARKGYRAVLTRTGDYYIAHRKRTAMAREARADLFVSIHADAFTSAAARVLRSIPCPTVALPVKLPRTR